MQSSNNPKLQAIIARKRASKKKRQEEMANITPEQLLEKIQAHHKAEEEYRAARAAFLEKNPTAGAFGVIYTEEKTVLKIDQEKLQAAGIDVSKYQTESKIMYIKVSKNV